jgi:hypothetical protein
MDEARQKCAGFFLVIRASLLIRHSSFGLRHSNRFVFIRG